MTEVLNEKLADIEEEFEQDRWNPKSGDEPEPALDVSNAFSQIYGLARRVPMEADSHEALKLCFVAVVEAINSPRGLYKEPNTTAH